MNINLTDVTFNDVDGNYVCVFITHATLKLMTLTQNQNIINGVSHMAIIRARFLSRILYLGNTEPELGLLSINQISAMICHT